MKPNLPDALKHKFLSDKLWKNEYSERIGDGFTKTLPEAVYQELLKYYEDNHGDQARAELNELNYKVVRTSLPISKENYYRAGDGQQKEMTHPFVSLAKTQGQRRGGFEVAIAVEKDGGYAQALIYINPMGDVVKSWR